MMNHEAEQDFTHLTPVVQQAMMTKFYNHIRIERGKPRGLNVASGALESVGLLSMPIFELKKCFLEILGFRGIF